MEDCAPHPSTLKIKNSIEFSLFFPRKHIKEKKKQYKLLLTTIKTSEELSECHHNLMDHAHKPWT
jgi:hypothetical protein